MDLAIWNHGAHFTLHFSVCSRSLNHFITRVCVCVCVHTGREMKEIPDQHKPL